MLKAFAVIISIFLIIIILLQIPKDNMGIRSRRTIFGSSNSALRFLNVVIGLSILIYIAVAAKLNLTHQ